MTYYESAEGKRISKQKAYALLNRHGVVAKEYGSFEDEVKHDVNGMYLATDVLEWLGY